MDGNRLGSSKARREEMEQTEREQQVSRELLQEYMLKPPQQVQVGVAS